MKLIKLLVVITVISAFVPAFAAERVSSPNFRLDSRALAESEVRMWQFYYSENRIALMREISLLLSQQFHLSVVDTLTVGYALSQAALKFANMPAGSSVSQFEHHVLPQLEQFYRVLKQKTGANWSAKTVANAELNWWLVRRKPGRQRTQRTADALSHLYAALFGQSNRCLLQAAQLRARAAALRDSQQTRGAVDWLQVKALLHQSYQRLFRGVSGCHD